jgi:hypothetical protein
MKNEELFRLAAGFLDQKGIGYVNDGKIGRKKDDKVEVIFPVPETLDPDVAFVDPEDVRVWVSLVSGEIELIQQM